MKILLTILLVFLAGECLAQVPVIQRGSAGQVVLDQRFMAGKNLYLPRVLGKPAQSPFGLNGGVDTLGAQVYNILDSSVYIWVGGTLWVKLLSTNDTNAVIATQNYVNTHSAMWGGITGNIQNQIDLQNEFGTTVKYADTNNGKIATPHWVLIQGFITHETDPIALFKYVTIFPGYGISGTGLGSFPLGFPPTFTVTVDTTKMIPYTDTLRGYGVATKFNLLSYYNPSDSGRCSACLVTGGSLNAVADSLSIHAGVTSFNTRVGAVTSQTGDYTYNQVTNAAGLPANQIWSGSNTYNGATIMNNGAIINNTPNGTLSDSILTEAGGVVRKIPAISATFITFSDSGRCASCWVTGGSLTKVVDSIIISGTAGVSSFNGRTGAVVPTAGDYSYALLSGNGSTSITTVGTIVTGTWQGSPIQNAYIANDFINTQTDNGGTAISWNSTSVVLGGNALLHVPAAGTGITYGAVTNGSQSIAGAKTFLNGWIISANSTPSADSTYALGDASFRFNNIFTALPAQSSGVYSLVVENYANGNLETVPASALGTTLTVGLIDSLPLSYNGASIAGNRLIMQLATNTYPGLIDTSHYHYLDSLQKGLKVDTLNIGHAGPLTANWIGYAANNRTLVLDNMYAGFGIQVVKNSDSSNLIQLAPAFSNSRDTIYQTNIGAGSFPVLSPIYNNGSTWALCDTTHPPQAIVSKIISTNSVEVTYNGKIVVSGGTGLTPGNQYFVTMPAGSVSSTSPQESFPVFFCTNSTTVIVSLQRPFNFNNIGGGSGNPNSNIGTGFRMAVPNTNNIKTLNPGFGIALDSSSATNEITIWNDNPEATRDTISQTAHGFTLGETVSRGASAWVAADTISNFADGVVSKVIDVNTFEVTYAGKFTWPLHALTVGSIYYQSTSAGGLTSTSPFVSIPILKPISANVVVVSIKRPFNFKNNLGTNVITVTGNLTAPTSYLRNIIIVNATSATITLPDPTLSTSQGIFYMVRVNTSGQTATVATAGSANIETSLGTFSATATVTGVPITGWVSDGVNWRLSN